MKLDYVGWQVGINYQAADAQGIDLPYLKQVIDRSADSGMNFISLMMLSYAYFCPEHDGYAWPVRNPRLEPLRDQQCLNANPRREFGSEALAYAKSKGFHCQLMLNAMIWNPQKVAVHYPQATAQTDREGKTGHGWLFCPDSPGAWQLAIDEVTDLLQFYKDCPVDSYAFERIGYTSGTCFCTYSRNRFREDTDTDLGASPLAHLIWKGNTARRLLSAYVAAIRATRPGISVWAHSGGDPEWGHFPHVLRDTSIEVVNNHGQHFLKTEKAFHQQLDWLSPLPCVPHICVRDMPTQNYNIPIRTPQMIRDYARWLETYPGDRVRGAMFFNEVRTSERNKAAVYDVVRQWRSV
jgi:hypothetical protein